MSTITAQFDLHTRLYRNVITGIADQAAATPAGPNSNHLKFLAGHLVYTRLMMKDFAGLPGDDRFAQFDKNMDPKADYLPMRDILAKWDEIADPISKAVAALPAQALAGNGPFPTPCGPSMEDFLSFLMHHEAYHIGQMGILRKIAGAEAMKYD
jgi:uncharacterized damage-inducible protein DinB